MIDEVAFRRILHRHYRIEGSAIQERPGGWASLAYRVQTPSAVFFLKVYEKIRASTPKLTARLDDYLPIVHWLGRETLLRGRIVEPVPTAEENWWCEDEKYLYVLFRYIDGHTIGDDVLDLSSAEELADIVAALHTCADDLPHGTDGLAECYAVPFGTRLRSFLEEGILTAKRDIADVVAGHLPDLRRLIEHCETAARNLRGRELPFVLCHTDIHGWNLMRTTENASLVLLDWEGLTLAPAEADLFLLRDRPFFEVFMRRYREMRPGYRMDKQALSFYSGRRLLEDIWEFIEQLTVDGLEGEPRQRALAYLAGECAAVASALAVECA